MNITKFIFGTITALLTLLFTIAYYLNPADEWWVECYFSTIALALIFLWNSRNNLLTLSPIFVSIYLIAITFPVMPYFLFNIITVKLLNESIFVNALGLMAYLSMAFYLFPIKEIRYKEINYLTNANWQTFFRVNRKIFIFTLPILLFVIIYSGGWRVFFLGFNAKESGFDRMTTLYGMGPLMIFSYLNVYSGTFLTIGYWARGEKIKAVMCALFFLTLNGFTGGRGNAIWFFMAILLFYGTQKKVTFKVALISLIAGLAIVLSKWLRSLDTSSGITLEYILFNFVGDFDSINNVSALLDYIKRTVGYPGFYHIWSDILIFVPRFLVPDKPYDVGGFYLNTLIFPGIYFGAQGGTGLSFGVAGILLAVSGITSLVIGCMLLGIVTCWFDKGLLKFVVNHNRPTSFLILYLMILGQVIVLYRDGTYAFMNMLFFYICYRTVYLFFANNTIADK
ncbi:MAG: hypothetical protein K0R14_598 [Burkholderiales bacterium]|jgi:hypothetical protein|nr:hypothetical protein [Burkholderiales bacterium]